MAADENGVDVKPKCLVPPTLSANLLACGLFL